jgi:NADH:ubiquinone reductase (non-electrogenic)
MTNSSFSCKWLRCLRIFLCLVLSQISAASAFTRSLHTGCSKTTYPSSLYASSRGSSNAAGIIEQPHIVILGGGFGGINSALTLPTLPWSDSAIKPKITLIDKSERFVFLPLLYELCVDDASIDEVAPTFKSLLNGVGGGKATATTNPLSVLSDGLPDLSDAIQLLSGTSSNGDNEDETATDNNCDVSFLQAQVEGIDANNNQLVITLPSNGDTDKAVETINYDALIISTGAEISCDAVPGASEFALPFYTVDQCYELKRRLALIDNHLEGIEKTDDKSKQSTNVVVVGGGYSGVELALNLVDRLGSSNVQVTLVHRGEQVLEYATEHNRNAGSERLKSAGVKVMTSTSVDEVTSWDGPRGANTMNDTLQKQQCIVKLSTTSGSDKNNESAHELTEIPTTLLLWTAGSTPTSTRNTGIRNSILPRDTMGRILTSPTLNVAEYQNVFAIGDCSRPKKIPYPGTAQVAMQQATVASWNVYATLVNTTAKKNGSRRGEQNAMKLLPFSYLNLGEMMTLGNNDATISTLGGIELNGPAASWLRRLVYAVRMPTSRQGLFAAVDGSSRKLVRGALRSNGKRRRKSKPVDWK